MVFAQTHGIAREVGYRQAAVEIGAAGKIAGDEVEVEPVLAVGIYSVAVDSIGYIGGLQERNPAAVVGPRGPVGHAGASEEGNRRCGPSLFEIP